jgi:hypothetical protein
MTEQTLDRVARALATGMPRRRVAKGLLAGGAAGTLAVLGARQSKAADDACRQHCRESRRSVSMHVCLCGECGIGCPPRRD